MARDVACGAQSTRLAHKQKKKKSWAGCVSKEKKKEAMHNHKTHKRTRTSLELTSGSVLIFTFATSTRHSKTLSFFFFIFNMWKKKIRCFTHATPLDTGEKKGKVKKKEKRNRNEEKKRKTRVASDYIESSEKEVCTDGVFFFFLNERHENKMIAPHSWIRRTYRSTHGARNKTPDLLSFSQKKRRWQSWNLH